MSGGNRDVMLNGWLELPGGAALIVEVQLHLAPLFALKKVCGTRARLALVACAPAPPSMLL